MAINSFPLPQMPENAPAPLPPPFTKGDAVPWFRIASDINPDFNVSTLAGHILVLSFLGSLAQPATEQIAKGFLEQNRNLNHGVQRWHW